MSPAYVGTELELFAPAKRWKAYFARALAPFIAGRVLEVGAGIGSNVPYLHGGGVREWTSLEPDPTLARKIAERVASGEFPGDCRVVTGTLRGIAGRARFDTILYVDVLEHIADDGAELARAAELLAPGGRLVVLAPAHQFLFSPFDAAVGHYRRYSAASLTALQPPGCCLSARLMLDSAGLLASLANRLLLRSATPSARQIAFWDSVLVPLSRVLDGLFGRRLGKTVVAVWSRAA